MRTPLQKEEKILLVTYSSWTVLILPVIIMLAGFVASYFIGFIKNFGWIAAVIGIIVFLAKYFKWKVTLWVVTNFRVIDEGGLFNHFAKESPLDKINNVSYDQNIWGRIFNYGHVEIQTAAEIGATDYYDVQHPKRLKDTITLAQSDFQTIQSGKQASQLAAAMGISSNRPLQSGSGSGNIASELEKLFNLHQQGILSEEEYNQAKAKLLNS
jgi:uncharacterized membrane protein YdbT with pleckstrin-like domain